MDLPLDARFCVGFITGAATGGEARAITQLGERLGYDSIWVGDHVAFTVPILDPLLQLAAFAAASEKLQLGTAIFLLPLRHPTHVAKQVATLDLLCGGRLIFGVGVGGEFPVEYEACEVPLRERGARLSEAIPLLKRLWNGPPVDHSGRFWSLPTLQLRPRPAQTGGPPIWCGGRSAPALKRIGRMGDGWLSYVVRPERFAAGLTTIAAEAERAGRKLESFGSGHLLFTCISASYEDALDKAASHLSVRYGMDFRDAARKYAALGRPEDVAETVDAFRAAGVRHLIIDPVGPLEDREPQLELFAQEVRPLL